MIFYILFVVIFEHTIMDSRYHMITVWKWKNNTKNHSKILQKNIKNNKNHEKYVLRLITDGTVFTTDTRAIWHFFVKFWAKYCQKHHLRVITHVYCWTTDTRRVFSIFNLKTLKLSQKEYFFIKQMQICAKNNLFS